MCYGDEDALRQAAFRLAQQSAREETQSCRHELGRELEREFTEGQGYLSPLSAGYPEVFDAAGSR